MSAIFESNLKALSRTHADLASRLASSKPAPEISFITAKNGLLVPAIAQSDSPLPFHSTFEPVREGLRLFDQNRGAGFAVFLGLGAGYQISPFLRDPGVSAILIIERGLSTVRAILEKVEMAVLFEDERVRLLVDQPVGAIEETILSAYLPAVMGNLRTIPLRARCRSEKEYFTAVSDEIEKAAEKVKADYAAQARFGKRWFANTLLNLPLVETASLHIPRADSVLIVGAGPSLDAQIPRLRRDRARGILIATDTSLPALLANKIRPDLVISIDCQHYGYHHVLASRADSKGHTDMPFLLELASPPALSRAAGVLGFFAGGHPFSRYIRHHWLNLPALDTSGGNVSHAAVSLAIAMGAHEIILYGMDFSYPDGKSYVRGTYISHLFDSLATRLAPTEASNLNLVFRGGDVSSERLPDGYRYTTPLLLSYRDSMNALIKRTGARVTCTEGRGLPLSSSPHSISKVNSIESISLGYERPKSGKDWRGFLGEYRRDVSALQAPSGASATAYLRGLSPAQMEVCMTILPLVPCLEKETGESSDRLSLLARAREWTLTKLDQVL